MEFACLGQKALAHANDEGGDGHVAPASGHRTRLVRCSMAGDNVDGS